MVRNPFSSFPLVPDGRSFSSYYQLPRSIFAEERKTFPRSLGKWMKSYICVHRGREGEIINSVANDFLFLSIPDGCSLPRDIDHLNGLTLRPELSRLGRLLLRIQRKEASNVWFGHDFLQDSENWNSSSGQKCGRLECPITGVNSRIDLRNELPSNHLDKIEGAMRGLGRVMPK